ncbi:hypothetical protein ACJX0J_041755, partial [Zea mays]
NYTSCLTCPRFAAPSHPYCRPPRDTRFIRGQRPLLKSGALSCQSSPSPSTPRHPFSLPPAPSRCYRCLAADHQVRDCRDPIHCRGCCRLGHRQNLCPMPIARVLTPHPRRRPSIPAPARRVPGSAVPFPEEDLLTTAANAPAPPLKLTTPIRSPPSAPSSPDAVPGLLGPPPIPLGSTGAPASSGDDVSAPSWEGRTHFFEAWLPQGDLLLKNRLAFAFLDNPAAIPDISAFVGAALGSACPDIHVELLPSTRGVKLLRFDNNSDRERLRGLSPISFEGASLSLERPEETSNRFIRSPEWLALVALTDFPPEQWSEASIRRCFTAGAEVLEINPDCLDGHNFGPLQLVLEVNHYLDIPYEILVSEHCGLSREGSLVQVMPLQIWPRSAQLDPAGRLIPFFHHPHRPTSCCTSAARLAIQWCSPLPLPCHPPPPSPTPRALTWHRSCCTTPSHRCLLHKKRQ